MEISSIFIAKSFYSLGLGPRSFPRAGAVAISQHLFYAGAFVGVLVLPNRSTSLNLRFVFAWSRFYPMPTII